jgi:hypothetical protein
MAMAGIKAVGLAVLQEEFRKVLVPVFDFAGHLVVDTAKKVDAFFRDIVGHHHHIHPVHVRDTDLIIDELSSNVGLRMGVKLTVVFSPEDKLNGVSYENVAIKASKARDQDLECIALRVKYAYENKKS